MGEELKSGDLIGGRFRLSRDIGKGAFGTVWMAEDLSHEGRPVAVKVLRDHHTQNPHVLQRFAREAQILERFAHPAVTQPVAWSVHSAPPFLAMEWVLGVKLSSYLSKRSARKETLSLELIDAFFGAMCAATAYAHKSSIVHRDIKPDNIMVTGDVGLGCIRMLDFGIAKILDPDDSEATTAGRVVGTPGYCAPEQIFAPVADQRVDLFALGSVLFELLTLRFAWRRDADGEHLRLHQSRDVIDANRPLAIMARCAGDERPRATPLRVGLVPGWDDVLARALAAEPAERYGSVDELLIAVRKVMSESTRIATAPTVLTRLPSKSDEATVREELLETSAFDTTTPSPEQPPLRVILGTPVRDERTQPGFWGVLSGLFGGRSKDGT